MFNQTDTAASMKLATSLTWKTPALLACGVGLLILVSTGSMSSELGGASLWVWVGTACMGALQSILIYFFAKKFPHKAGGTATYTGEALPFISKLGGAVSMWGYWLAWTPGIIVNALLAVGYLKAAFGLPGSEITWASGVLLLLYIVHYFGHRVNTKVVTVFSVLALLPFLAIAIALLLHPLSAVNPRITEVHALTFHSYMKWAFVAAWSAYGAEMASNVFSELRSPATDIRKSLLSANVICIVLFVGLPLLMLLSVGPSALSQDPTVSLLPVSIKLFGQLGFRIISLAIAASLLLGAQAFIIGSSRTLYQMSVDGILPVSFERLNRHHTPYRTILWDLLVISLLLAIFKGNVVNIVAVANVGYLVVFILLGLAAVVAAEQLTNTNFQRNLVLGVGAFVFSANVVILVVGGLQWGNEVFWIGFALLFTFLPVYAWRLRADWGVFGTVREQR